MSKPAAFLATLWLLVFTEPAWAIKKGAPATAYPEAVVLTADGFIPCSGVLVAPKVVLTAGHCSLGAQTKSYDVIAPNAPDSSGKAQQAHGSNDWTPYDKDPKTSSDIRLIFLDSAISITQYPTIASGKVASGTKVVDVGRSLDGTITENDYVSGEVMLGEDGSSLGLPFNYQALPDVSEDGDSGGPIELEDGSHTVVALVDTDTVEQQITETTPIDLVVRLDLVRDRIEAQIASPDAGTGTSDAGNGAPSSNANSSGGCAVGSRNGLDLSGMAAIILAIVAGSRRRSRPALYAIGFSKKRSAVCPPGRALAKSSPRSQ